MNSAAKAIVENKSENMQQRIAVPTKRFTNSFKKNTPLLDGRVRKLCVNFLAHWTHPISSNETSLNYCIYDSTIKAHRQTTKRSLFYAPAQRILMHLLLGKRNQHQDRSCMKSSCLIVRRYMTLPPYIQKDIELFLCKLYHTSN